MEVNKKIDILKQTKHRPFSLPKNDWTGYSEWKDVLLLHWKVDALLIKPFLPKELCIDTFEGGAWVTICISTVENFTTKLLSIFGQRLNFKQVLMQTYVIRNGKPGLFVFGHESEKTETKNIYQRVFKINNGNADITRESLPDGNCWLTIHNDLTGLDMKIEYRFGDYVPPSDITSWLTNRFKYYQDTSSKLYSFNIHHLEMKFRSIKLEKFESNYNFGELDLTCPPDFVQYSKGIQRLSWPKVLIK